MIRSRPRQVRAADFLQIILHHVSVIINVVSDDQPADLKEWNQQIEIFSVVFFIGIEKYKV
jgi:hypothetical protein